jgi:hypothetical protein
LLEVLIDDPDYEWLMIGASHIKVNPHAAGSRSGHQAARYVWPWMRMVCRSELLLQKTPALIAHKLAH